MRKAKQFFWYNFFFILFTLKLKIYRLFIILIGLRSLFLITCLFLKMINKELIPTMSSDCILYLNRTLLNVKPVNWIFDMLEMDDGHGLGIARCQGMRSTWSARASAIDYRTVCILNIVGTVRWRRREVPDCGKWPLASPVLCCVCPPRNGIVLRRAVMNAAQWRYTIWYEAHVCIERLPRYRF